MEYLSWQLHNTYEVSYRIKRNSNVSKIYDMYRIVRKAYCYTPNTLQQQYKGSQPVQYITGNDAGIMYQHSMFFLTNNVQISINILSITQNQLK